MLERMYLWLWAPAGLAGMAALAGCDKRPVVHADDPQVAAFLQVLMPRQIEVQKFLTRPVSLGGEGTADGLEVVLAAMDSLGDRVKVVGTFHFELYSRRPASGDRLGQRLAFWPVKIDSDEALLQYWDRLSRFYRFPLQLPSPPLEPGQYILVVRLLSPAGETLESEYEFEHREATVPTVSLRP